MFPGKFDRRIQIQTRSSTRGKTGAASDVWTLMANVWAQFVPLSGREILSAGEQMAQFDARFIVRYRSDFSEKNRIVFDGCNYDIQSIAVIGRRKEALEIRARRLR